ncbi:Uncharacterized protein TPAR_05619, partial [Tolypocladium paradoxum]
MKSRPTAPANAALGLLLARVLGVAGVPLRPDAPRNIDIVIEGTAHLDLDGLVDHLRVSGKNKNGEENRIDWDGATPHQEPDWSPSGGHGQDGGQGPQQQRYVTLTLPGPSVHPAPEPKTRFAEPGCDRCFGTVFHYEPVETPYVTVAASGEGPYPTVSTSRGKVHIYDPQQPKGGFPVPPAVTVAMDGARPDGPRITLPPVLPLDAPTVVLGTKNFERHFPTEHMWKAPRERSWRKDRFTSQLSLLANRKQREMSSHAKTANLMMNIILNIMDIILNIMNITLNIMNIMNITLNIMNIMDIIMNIILNIILNIIMNIIMNIMNIIMNIIMNTITLITLPPFHPGQPTIVVNVNVNAGNGNGNENGNGNGNSKVTAGNGVGNGISSNSNVKAGNGISAGNGVSSNSKSRGGKGGNSNSGGNQLSSDSNSGGNDQSQSSSQSTNQTNSQTSTSNGGNSTSNGGKSFSNSGGGK